MAGAGDGVTIAPPLAGSPRVQAHRDYVIKVLLNGLMGPIEDKNYPGGVMVAMGSNDDQWIADVASYVRNSFGNAATFVTAEQVAATRRATARKTPWTYAELDPTVPALLTNTSAWKLTASHNPDAAANAVGSAPGRWDSGVPQQPGMWFQIELPQPAMVAELQIDSMVPGRPLFAPAGRGAAPARRGRGGFVQAAGPIGYTVQVSLDGSAWSEPLAQGAGQTPSTIVTIKPTRAKFIRINQTGTAQGNEAWGLQQIRIYALQGGS
jgi:hypothetical protein